MYVHRPCHGSVVSDWALTSEAHVRSQASPHGIYVEPNDTGTGFSPAVSIVSVSINPTMHHTFINDAM